MRQQIIDLFNQSGKTKIEFKPSIQVYPPYSHKMWIDKVFKIGDNIMVNISNIDQDYNKKVEALDDAYLKPLKERLESILKN